MFPFLTSVCPEPRVLGCWPPGSENSLLLLCLLLDFLAKWPRAVSLPVHLFRLRPRPRRKQHRVLAAGATSKHCLGGRSASPDPISHPGAIIGQTCTQLFFFFMIFLCGAPSSHPENFGLRSSWLPNPPWAWAAPHHLAEPWAKCFALRGMQGQTLFQLNRHFGENELRLPQGFL